MEFLSISFRVRSQFFFGTRAETRDGRETFKMYNVTFADRTKLLLTLIEWWGSWERIFLHLRIGIEVGVIWIFIEDQIKKLLIFCWIKKGKYRKIKGKYRDFQENEGNVFIVPGKNNYYFKQIWIYASTMFSSRMVKALQHFF